MPSSKSVRFEDLDDGVDDGLYGMKVCLLSSIRFPATPCSHQLLHTGQQGILKNLYTQAGSYRKWVRSHSKKVCALSCCVISLRSSQTLIMHGPPMSPLFPSPPRSDLIMGDLLGLVLQHGQHTDRYTPLPRAAKGAVSCGDGENPGQRITRPGLPTPRTTTNGDDLGTCRSKRKAAIEGVSQEWSHL